jgi:hypothetical protein
LMGCASRKASQPRAAGPFLQARERGRPYPKGAYESPVRAVESRRV